MPRIDFWKLGVNHIGGRCSMMYHSHHVCLSPTWIKQFPAPIPCLFPLNFMSENWVLCVTSLLSLFSLPMDLLLFSLKITYLKNVYLKNFFTQYILPYSFFQLQLLSDSTQFSMHPTSCEYTLSPSKNKTKLKI